MAKKTAAAADPGDEKKPIEDKIRKADLERIRKSLGLAANDSSMMPADQYEAVSHIISTGHAEMDRILTPTYFDELGTGGIPRGFVCEFFGPFAGGKSSLCLMLAGSATRAGDKVLWIDAEGSYVPFWAESHGVVNSRVMRVGPPKTGEEYLEIVEHGASSGEFALVVIDSVTGLVPKIIMETPLEDNARIAAQAGMMSRAMPRLVPAAKKGNCAVIFINQIRMKPGIVYGNPETTPGGEALRFFSSLRVRLSQIGSKDARGIIKDGEEIGIRSKAQVVKSRFGPPYKETVLPIYYNKNVKPHPLDMLLDMALASKIIKCKTKKQDGHAIESFTLEGDAELRSIESFDAFKAELQTQHIKAIALKLSEKKPLEAELVSYLKSLEEDPTI